MHREPGMRWDGESPIGKYLRPDPQVDLCLERRHFSFHCHGLLLSRPTPVTAYSCHGLLLSRWTHQCHVLLATSVDRTVMNTSVNIFINSLMKLIVTDHDVERQTQHIDDVRMFIGINDT